MKFAKGRTGGVASAALQAAYWIAKATLPALIATAAHAAPLVITRGGVVRGSYSSDDPQVPAVTIKTREPVTLEGCTLTGRGPLIASDVAHANLTVRNTTGTGQNPNVAGKCAGRFINIESFDRLIVEHCELDQTAGIYLRDFQGPMGGSEPTVRIVANRARNIDGRRSDGHGKYLPFNLQTNLSTHQTVRGFTERQFVQLDRVHAPRMEIAWNYITNEPGQSRVEDNINLYNSGGLAGSPLMVHDNCIRGAYTIVPAQASSMDLLSKYDWSYSGGGIMLGDGSDQAVGAAAGFVYATGNVVIATSNYGIAVAAGHDIFFERNTVVSSGRLPDGQPVFAQNVGAYVWDEYHCKRLSPSPFFNDGGRANVIGWMKGEQRSDTWTPDAAVWSGNTGPHGKVTAADEQRAEREWVRWAQSMGVGVKPGESR